MAYLKLYINDAERLHQLILREDQSYTIGSDRTDSVEIPLLAETIHIAFNQEGQKWMYGTSEENLVALASNQKQETGQGITLFLVENIATASYSLLGEKTWRIGADKGALVQIESGEAFLFKKQATGGWLLHVLNQPVFLNYQLVEGEVQVAHGDRLYLNGVMYTIYEDELHVEGLQFVTMNGMKLAVSAYEYYEEYPDYHRSPRLIYRDPEEKFTIAAPSSEPSKPTEQILKLILPPLIMISMSILMAIFNSRGIFVLATVATTLVTLIFSITNFIKSNKQYKIDSAERITSYENYLTRRAEEIHQSAEEQKNGKLYHYPDVATLVALTSQYNHRIYEKTALHHDFLTYRLGLGDVKLSSDIEYSVTDGQKAMDDLEKQANDLYLQSTMVKDVPIITDLKSGPLGYIGNRKYVIEQLQLLVNQLSFFHSYLDLQFVTVFPEEELEDWKWMRWLPHATLQEMNVRGFVYHQRSRDQVLNSLVQILKNRKNALNEKGNSKEGTIFTPHYVVLITDEKMILDHAIMEFFSEDPSELGCSIIFVQDVLSSLPENIKTIIDVRDSKTGVMVLENDELKNTRFNLDHFPEDFDKEKLPRTLAPLNHLQNLKSSIPGSVTFMEMYGVDKFEELNVLSRWGKNSPHKSLAVPLGVRGKDDIVYLNLHEKAHGPHGLVAGTTGSGKSEIIQSYILSLAVNFHPYEVAFLLIDYKGGGMANLFKNLPHLLGSITNLDGAQSMRALISINAELKRRQRMFSENDVNHINQYQKLYKDGEVTEPMPHLFLISDEFAELKAEQPEFMQELVSTARIGRSLGIHLILATQKPSGVVNDQIWSNSKFKLALKVADKSDSMEMLKTPDAAEIVEPGRAYLQVGNNEIYELFQSAWSGADYLPGQAEQEVVDSTIYAINELGQYDILSEDLSGLEGADEVKTVPTELEAVIDGVHDLTEAQGIVPLPRPWLPPLKERIYLPELQELDYKEAWVGAKETLKPVIGIADIPSMQAQNVFDVNLSEDGHIALYASPGYGKSTFLQAILMGLARAHNPERLHAYLLDFGTNGLLPLRQLPHVADTMNIDENEKIGKFIRRMAAEIKRRKQLLSTFAVASMEMYEKASGKEEPSIVIFIDGYEGFKGAGYESELETIVTQIAREGAGIGMHLMITAGRQASLRANLQSNIKVNIALKMIDDNEPRSIVGRTTLTIEDVKGRGMIKFEEPSIFQAALPTLGEGTLEIIGNIQAEAKEMDEGWSGNRPKPIPMVPDELRYEDFKAMESVQRDAATNNLVPFAVDFEDVESISWNAYGNNLLFTGTKAQESEDFAKQVMKQLREKEKGHLILLDTAQGSLGEFYEQAIAVANDKESYTQLLEMLQQRIVDRSKTHETYQAENPGGTKTSYLETQELMYVVLHQFNKLMEEFSSADKDMLLKLMTDGQAEGIVFITVTDIFEFAKGYDDVTKLLKRSEEVILKGKLNDQSTFTASNKSYKEEALKQGEAYVIKEGMAHKVKLPE